VNSNRFLSDHHYLQSGERREKEEMVAMKSKTDELEKELETVQKALKDEQEKVLSCALF